MFISGIRTEGEDWEAFFVAQEIVDSHTFAIVGVLEKDTSLRRALLCLLDPLLQAQSQLIDVDLALFGNGDQSSKLDPLRNGGQTLDVEIPLVFFCDLVNICASW